VTKIPHHHAHASSLLLDVPKSKHWLVFTWDGVGLGTDGQLWGGETFIGQPGVWQRVASFSPFRLPGGEKTAREAWRIASSLCWHADIDVEINNEHLTQLKRQWDKQLNAPTSSAVGRLFSAAAALLGLVQVETFAGHGPMLLEALAETTHSESLVLPFTQDEAGILRIDWQPLVYMLKDNSLSVAQRARCFHETLAECVCVISQSYAERQQDLTIGLSGGVFQNQLLIKLIQNKLQQNDLTVILPSSVPANDGGLCAGQIIEYFYRGQ
jgi:hydrogenase maturation protein HypF